jgi:hypothetical protein
MEKVQVQTEIDIKTFLSQLGNKELEEFLREISALMTRRKTGNKKAREVELLRQLNEDCVLPESHWLRFNELTQQRDAGKLTSKESKELFSLIKQEEQLRLQRIKILGELAQIKGNTLEALTVELGINTPKNA